VLLRARVSLARPGELHLLIIDATGRELLTQDLGTLAEGPHTIELATNGLPAGAYFVRIRYADAPGLQSQFVIAR
jgi:hypothetical protein